MPQIDQESDFTSAFPDAELGTNAGYWRFDPGGSSASGNTGPGTNNVLAFMHTETSGSSGETDTEDNGIAVFGSVPSGPNRRLSLRVCIQGDFGDGTEGLAVQSRAANGDEWIDILHIYGWEYRDDYVVGGVITDENGIEITCVADGGWVDFGVDIPDSHTQVRLRPKYIFVASTFLHDIALRSYEWQITGPIDHTVDAGDISWSFATTQPTITHTIPPPRTNYSHTGLSPSTRRWYRVSAINVNGAGLASNIVNAITDSAVMAVVIIDTQITSIPQALSDTYGVGETIIFSVTWNGPVDVIGNPQFPVNLGQSPSGGPEYADYLGGNGTAIITFRWVVSATDEDTNGVFFYGSTDSQNRGDIIGGTIRNAGTQIDADRATLNRGTKSGHKVDGSLGGVIDHTVNAGDVSWSFATTQPTITHTIPTDHIVNAGDVSWLFATTQPTITYVSAQPIDHTVNAGDVSWSFATIQPTVTHTVPTNYTVNAGDVLWLFVTTQPTITHTSLQINHVVNAGDVSWSFTTTQPTITHFIPNILPIVNVTTLDQTVDSGDVISLMATASDSDGIIVTYLWTGSNDIFFDDSSVQNTTWIAPSSQIEVSYILRLTVTDNEGAESYSTVTIIVRADPTVISSDLSAYPIPSTNLITAHWILEFMDKDFNVWSGDGDLVYDGKTYLGGGQFISLSPVEVTLDQPDQRLTATLVAGDNSITQMFITDKNIYVVEVIWIISIDKGLTYLNTGRRYRGRTNNPIYKDGLYTVELEPTLNDQYRQRPRTWSDDDQREVYPDDKGFEFASELSETEATARQKWPS